MVKNMKVLQTAPGFDQIAITGMAGRFPGALSLKQFWHNLVTGVESVSFFSRDELLATGVPEEKLNNRQYVGAKGILEGVDSFDARYFDLTGREATVMDPQFRIFLETVVEAMEDSGYTADNTHHRTGVFAGAGSNTYQEHLRAHPQLIDLLGHLQATLLNEKDFLPTWAAFKLNLTGPCVNIQSACATSLVAVHLACQSLLNGECDTALAGGVSLSFPHRAGYLYVEGGLLSPDGHCRAFDANAMGCVPGEGVGVVVLKRLEDAIKQGYTVRAVIKSSGINNDGSDKIGYLAPSENGIAAVAAECVAVSGVDCESIRYVEAHGTGTTLGDPIEVAALTKAFRAQTAKKQFCALGSVKTNIGHLNTASGIASLIKTVLALENRIIPPSLNCDEPNPLIKFSQTPFYVSTQAEEWGRNGTPRRAAVNTFGIGGTNAHVVLEEAPLREREQSVQGRELLLLSAKSESALVRASEDLAAHLEESPEISLAEVAYTLSVGRRAHEHRRVVVCSDVRGAVEALRENQQNELVAPSESDEDQPVTFVFRGGAEGSGLVSDLYSHEPVFRQEFDRCATTLRGIVSVDLRAAIAEGVHDGSEAREPFARAPFSAAASLAVSYALAKLLISWSVNPRAIVGEGLGEYVGACLAGLLSLEEALSLAVRNEKLLSLDHTSSAGESVRQVPECVGDRSPNLAFFSTALGRWTSPEDVLAVEQWSEGLLTPTAAAQASGVAVDAKDYMFEIGNGNFSQAQWEDQPTPDAAGGVPFYCDTISDREKLLAALGSLWLAKVPVDWQSVHSNRSPLRIPLPAYPFERRRYWAGDDKVNDPSAERQGQSDGDEIAAEPATEPSRNGYEEPVNDLQAVVTAVWSTYLGSDRIGIHDGFFTLGGNSLIATRIVLAIRETLQIDLPLRSLFDNPTVAGFAEEIEKAAQTLDTDIYETARLVKEIVALPSEEIEKRLVETLDSF